MFSENELNIKQFIETTLVPTIHQKVSEGNPIYYIRYGGRCCKQIAYLLSLYLNKALPKYEWSAWESIFSDIFDDYSHAWVYGHNKENSNDSIMMDYGKLDNEYSFFLKTSRNDYPILLENYYGEHDHMELDRESKGNRKELKPVGLETFTQKTYDDLFLEIETELNIQY